LLWDCNLFSIQDPAVRTAMILRIMRYVSFHPWGSVRADANRRGRSLEQIVNRIWNPAASAKGIGRFMAGGGVVWIPVIVGTHGRIKTPDRVEKYVLKPEERRGWLASRESPLKKKTEGVTRFDPLQLDLTERLVMCKADKGKKCLEVLYDCRFLLRFSMDKMPDDVWISITCPGRYGEILVQPQSKWYWPKVVWRRPGILDEDLCSFDGSMDDHWTVKQTTQAWIDIEWIRPLDAL